MKKQPNGLENPAIPVKIKDTAGIFGFPKKIKKIPPVIAVPNFLSAKECDEIISWLTPDSDKVFAEDGAYGGKGDERIEANNFCLDPNTTYDLHVKAVNKCRKIGKRIFKTGDLFANFQYPMYVSEYWRGCFRAFHWDGGIVDPTGKSFHDKYQEKLFYARSLTCVVQLSSPDDYTGGNLGFMSYQDPRKTDDSLNKVFSAKGTAVIFPSHVWHEVQKVKSGVRYSLSLFLYENK